MWLGLCTTLLLLQLGQQASAKRLLRNQFEESCPVGCRCGPTTIECHDLQATTTELFRHALPIIYPNLDSLIVTGNNFGELPAENIFTGNSHHQHLNYMDLSNNGIRSFGAQTFIGAPRVEYFDLTNNKIEAFIDAMPLKYLTSLKILNLTSAFNVKSSARQRADLLQLLFDSDHDFVDLSEIILTGNQLEHIHSNTFCRVKGLARLILRNNDLTSLDFDDGCLATLSLLDMSRNKIYSVPSSLWQQLQLLNSIDLSLNPLHCSCNLQEFHEFALDNAVSFLAQQETTCASPRSVQNKSVFELESNFCGGRGNLFRWFVLLLVGGAILYVYFWLRKNGRQLKMPSLVAGYTQLRDENIATQQPAFV